MVLWFILALVFGGLIVGALARLALPGAVTSMAHVRAPTGATSSCR